MFRLGSVYIIGMDMFLWPEMIVLIVLPFIIRWIVPAIQHKNSTAFVNGALRVPFFSNIVLFASSVEQEEPKGTRGVLGIMWLCFVAAMMRPIVYDHAVDVPREARNIMLAVDVSESMAQQDFDMGGRPVSRLAMVRDVVGDFIQKRVGDRIGLVVFGSEAHLLAPLSRDRKALSSLFADVGIGVAGGQTAIGDALAQAVKGTAVVPASKKVIILLSDGYNNAGVVPVDQAIELAQKQNIKVYTIGIGSDQKQALGFFGNLATVGADLDEKLLKQIAQKTGGRYFRAKSAADLEAVYREVDALEAISDTADFVRPQKELFWLPLSIGMVLLLIALWQQRGIA